MRIHGLVAALLGLVVCSTARAQFRTPRSLSAKRALRTQTSEDHRPWVRKDISELGTGASTTAVLLGLPLDLSGSLLTPTAQTDLWLVADDVSAGNVNWPAHGSTSYSAAVTGTNTVGIETPLYAGGGFSGAGYRKALQTGASSKYVLAAGTQNTLASDVTYEVVFGSGKFTALATLLGNHSTGHGGFEFEARGTDEKIRFLVFDGADAGAITLDVAMYPDAVQNTPTYTYWLVTAVWVASTKTVTLYFNGKQVGTANTASTLPANTTDGLGIGIRNGDASHPNSESQFIEIMRHAGLAMSSSQVAQRFQEMVGVRDVSAQYPSTQTRNSYGTALINNQLWRFGTAWPRFTSDGYLSEGAVTNLLKDSTFTQTTLSTNWTVTASGTTTVAYDSSSVHRFSTVGGKAVLITNDSTPSNGLITQNVTVTTSTKYTLSLDHEEPSGGQVYYRVKNTTTGNFLQSNGTWGSTVCNAIGSSTATRVRDSVTFTTESSGTTLTIDLGNCGSPAVNISKALYLYHAQLEAHAYPTSRVITTTLATTQRVADLLGYDTGGSGFSLSVGSQTMRVVPEWSTSAASGTFGFVGTDNLVMVANDQLTLKASDGTNTTTSASLTWTAGTVKALSETWGSSAVTISSVTNGVTASGTFNDNWGGATVYIGASNAGSQCDCSINSVQVLNK